MLTFYDGYPSDHRALFADLKWEYLFTHANTDSTRKTHRRFTTDNVKKTDKYLHNLERLLEEARIFKKIKKLEEEIKNI